MKIIAKRNVQATSEAEASRIALASIHGSDKPLVRVECHHQSTDTYRCFAGYKTKAQLRKEGYAGFNA